MVDIYPFKAFRPTTEKKQGDVSPFICPPYDVISPEERASIVRKSKSNVVQLELPEGEGDEKYRNAAQLLDQWKSANILQQDRHPSYYLIETTYRINDAFAPSKFLKRYGVLTSLRLETPRKGNIHPHEKTLPKAKEDRLKLISAVKTNISPIFGLFFDSKNEWGKWVARMIKKPVMVTGQEHANLKHRLWKIDDDISTKMLTKLLKPKHLYIADGHHRYEVAWAYKEQCLRDNPNAAPQDAFHKVMAYVCPMEERGLLMLPTHRLVTSHKSLEEWRNHLSNFFDFTPVKSVSAIVEALSKPKTTKRVLGYMTQEGNYLLTLKASLSLASLLKDRPKALRNLDVVLLHDLAMGEAPGLNFLPTKEFEYTRDLSLMTNKIKANKSTVGFLVASAGVASLAEVAKAGEVMPPKTTYFYPKVPTGFTLMSVEGIL